MRVTRRGAAVLLTGVLLMMIGWWGPYPLPAALGAAGVAAVLAAPLFTARGVVARVERTFDPDRVERGQPATATLRVSNGSARRQGGFHVTDTVGGSAHQLRVASLAPGGEAVLHYRVPTGARGRHTVGPLLVHRSDPFGFARRHLRTGAVTTLWVHPRRLPARPVTGGDPRQHHEAGDTSAVPRGSVDLADVREYVPGDEVRHLHWKATARTGRLMVSDLVDPHPRSGRFTVLLDTRAGVLTPAGFEEAVDVTASLVCAAVVGGQRARLVLPSGPDLTVHGGFRAVRGFLDTLSGLTQAGTPADPLVPGPLSTGTLSTGPLSTGPLSTGPLSTGTLPAGGALVVVTAGALGVAAAARLRHRFTTVVVIALAGSDTLTGSRVGVRVLRADDAVEAVRRWNEAVR